MKSAAMARSAWRAYLREWGVACDASLDARIGPDEYGFIPWPLAEHVDPVDRRWLPVKRWVRRELGPSWRNRA